MSSRVKDKQKLLHSPAHTQADKWRSHSISGNYLREGQLKRFAFIESERKNYPLSVLCRTMKVSAGGYYAWRNRLNKPPSLKRRRTIDLIRNCFWEHRRRYGSRRIAAELQRCGERIGRFAVRRVMRAENLRAIQPKKFVPKTTDSSHGQSVNPNLLARAETKATEPGAVLVGDITYLPLSNGQWCYLAIWQDKFTRRIVGWAVSARMTAELVIRALQKALLGGRVEPDAIIHTDRGSQYVAQDFRSLLVFNNLRQSMSGKGNCYDNAQAESWFSRFKTELIEDGVFATVEEARSEVFSYIEGYYNCTRLHSGLGYQSPAEFEAKLKRKEHEQRESLMSTFS
jgi:putative transposase